MALIYTWIAIAGIGFFTAIAVLSDSVTFHRYLRRARPELVASHRVEIVRDAIMLTIHGGNLAVGVAALVYAQLPQYFHITRPLTVLGLLIVASLLTLTSVFNFYLRHWGKPGG